MQPLLLMKQTLEAPFDPGPLLLDGPNVHISEMRQALAKSLADTGEFSVGLETDDDEMVEVAFRRPPKGGVHLARMTTTVEGLREPLVVSEGPVDTDVARQLTRVSGIRAARNRKRTYHVVRDRCFLVFEIQETEGIRTIRYRFFGLPDASARIQTLIERLIHLPGLRATPERSYPSTAIGTMFPGTFDSYVASVVSQWQAKSNEAIKRVSKQLEDLGLTWKVAARQITDTSVELTVGRLPHARQGGAFDLVNVADVGFGVSQVLPVLVALEVARPGQLVYLEQPEIHLHPRAQTTLARIIAAAAKRGVQIVVETHSSLVLRGVQTAVAEGELPPNLVKLHWFSRSDVDGSSTVRSADMDERGSFGDWPEDFDDVVLTTERDYLNAVAKRVSSAE
jgi:hypothetical protein